jgi:hypothetical protein
LILLDSLVREERPLRQIEWVLRIALCGEFLGHGYFAFVKSPNFVKLITGTTGMGEDFALQVLPMIGVVDFTVAALALLWPFRLLAIYAAMWGLMTALTRPLSGMHIMDFVERWPNWGIPLALFFVLHLQITARKQSGTSAAPQPSGGTAATS